MKNGKRPTRAQKMPIQSLGFQPDNWLISKNTSTEMVIVHRFTGRTRVIPKRGLYDE
ncbi:MAG: hypothetical protein IJ496_09485 [Ruminococcus sp.]|nr:hypothetical protein [Ruminococcus sp.]